MPCASRWESHLSASIGPPVRHAKEAHFRKDETSSYTLCILIVHLKEFCPVHFGQRCRASLSEIWSVLGTSSSLLGFLSLAPVPPLLEAHNPPRAGMFYASSRAKTRELQSDKLVAWKHTNPQAQTKPNLVYCIIAFHFPAPQNCLVCYQL